MDGITPRHIDLGATAASPASDAPVRKKRTKVTVPDSERWAFSVDEAAAKAGVSRAWMWGLVKDRTIEAQHFRGRTWITADVLSEFLRNPPAS